MMMKAKIAIGVGVLLVAGVAYARSRKRPTLTCSSTSAFVAADKNSDAYKNGSPSLRKQIDRFGGYCAAQGRVDYVNGTSDAPSLADAPSVSEPDKDWLPDQVLITHPWQLM
jgi:hypothetical protein